jgi:hypothetical protein
MWVYASRLKSVISKLLYLSVDPSGRAKVWVCGYSLAGVVGSYPAGIIDVCFWDCCVLSGRRSLRRADHSSRGVLQILVCLSVISKPQNWRYLGPLGFVDPWGKINIYVFGGCELLLPKSYSLVICYRDSGWFFRTCLEIVDFEFTLKH